jgi:hypothetical protein
MTSTKTIMAVAALTFIVIFAGCTPQAETTTTEPIVAPEPVVQVTPAPEPVVLPQANVALVFKPGQTQTYKAVTSAEQGFKFDQPSDKKLEVSRTANIVEVTFKQKIESVDDQATATALITIKGLKVFKSDKKGVTYDYDSKNAGHAQKPFAKFLGKTYTITIAPNGAVTVLNANELRSTVTQKADKRIAKNIFSDKLIAKRHGILALPTETSKIKQTQSYSKIKASPPKLLAPKSFKKTYTLTDIKGDMLTVKMTAEESAIPAKDFSNAQGMGPFAKMFDTTETYGGQMTLKAGQLQGFSETLKAVYVAAEPSSNQKEGLGPDTLTLDFTYTVSIDKVK